MISHGMQLPSEPRQHLFAFIHASLEREHDQNIELIVQAPHTAKATSTQLKFIYVAPSLARSARGW